MLTLHNCLLLRVNIRPNNTNKESAAAIRPNNRWMRGNQDVKGEYQYVLFGQCRPITKDQQLFKDTNYDITAHLTCSGWGCRRSRQTTGDTSRDGAKSETSWLQEIISVSCFFVDSLHPGASRKHVKREKWHFLIGLFKLMSKIRGKCVENWGWLGTRHIRWSGSLHTLWERFYFQQVKDSRFSKYSHKTGAPLFSALVEHLHV